MFEAMIWGGAALSLLGLAGLMISVLRVLRARKSGLSDEDLRAAVQAAIPLNMGSLMLSVIGLMLVITGISLA